MLNTFDDFKTMEFYHQFLTFDLKLIETFFYLIVFQEALVVPYGYSWSFTIRPNDLREDRLPRDITESIHWLVSTR
jgi:hypothetical protein